MRTAVKVLVGLMVAAVVGFGWAGAAQAAAPGPAAASTQESVVVGSAAVWELWDSFTDVDDWQQAQAQCEITGAIGRHNGLWSQYYCESDGAFTFYLWVDRS
ncbi:hypothetical protein [Polymorphospora rubra]|uniref:hypothetical protein n=1 Tax=Polymorphospora rubra TaxID=338584 RepID=UPI0033F58195